MKEILSWYWCGCPEEAVVASVYQRQNINVVKIEAEFEDKDKDREREV